MQSKADNPGRLSIEAVDCVLSPDDRSPLIVFRGEPPASRILDSIEWLGQGSLLPSSTPFAGWTSGDGVQSAIDDAQIRVDGLARSELTFAGDDLLKAASSRIARWSAPLRGDNPPGVQPERLPTP